MARSGRRASTRHAGSRLYPHGLLKEADRFDPDRSYRFAIYAVWWIGAEIQDYKRAHVSIVRLPNSAQSRKVAGLLARLDAMMAADPDTDRAEANARIADDLGITIDRLADLRDQITGRGTSLNVPAFDDQSEDRMAMLVEALSNLPDRERKIVVPTQPDDPPATLDALGSAYGMSRERVRQLRKRGFERLREIMRERDLAPESLL